MATHPSPAKENQEGLQFRKIKTLDKGNTRKLKTQVRQSGKRK